MRFLFANFKKESLDKKGHPMPKIALNAPAPDFTLQDFSGETIRLSDFKEQFNVLLVFNRGFV